MRAILVSIGDELTGGETIDTNSAWLSAELSRLGVLTIEHMTVGDDLQQIKCVLAEACKGAEIVIVTGGLGPTDDDLTRFAAAELLGVSLECHAGWLDVMQHYFNRIGKTMVEKNRVQAMLPRGCHMLNNPVGTACGFDVTLGTAHAFFLPGVPREMKHICLESVFPSLEALRRDDPGGASMKFSRMLHCFGAGESEIAALLGDLMERGRNPLVNCTVSGGIITLRLHAVACTEAAAVEMLDSVESQLRRCLGDLIYGRDGETLAHVVGAKLTERGQTLAAAESCTGGLIAKLLTDVPGASVFFQGGLVTYSNDWKVHYLGVDGELIGRHGAVSEPVAGAMAENLRRSAAADYGLATTGIAGPSGGTADKPLGLVYIALAMDKETIVKRCLFTGDREMVRLRTALTALNILRLNGR